MAEDYDFAELIAAPIKAANDAQADAAANFVEQLERFAFEPHGIDDATNVGGAPRELQQVKFQAQTGLDENGESAKQEIAMPLLQLVPLSGLLIEDAKIEFECDLKARERANVAASPAALAMRGVAAANMQTATGQAEQRAPVSLAGSIAKSVGSVAGQSHGNLKIEMNLKKADLPSGYLDMLANTPATTAGVQTGSANSGIGQADQVGPGSDTNPNTTPNSSKREVTNRELFDAQIIKTSSDHIEPGKEFRCVVDVRFTEKLAEVGPLELELDAEPLTLFSVLDPKKPLQFNSGTQRVLVKIYADSRLKRLTRTKRATLILNGVAHDEDGVRHVLTRRIKIPLKNRSAT